MAKSKEKKKKDTEKVCEKFEVDKKGKEEVVTSCGEVEKEHSNQKEIEEQNKLLRNVLIGLGIFILTFAIFFYVIYAQKHLSYNDVQFDKYQMKDLLFYHTSYPISNGKKVITYNAYLRTNPKELAKVPFDGNLTVLKQMIINSTGDFQCDGDGVIAVANMAQIFNSVGSKVNKDENASCDEQGRYMFVDIQEGNETKVTQFGPACYTIEVKNCEIIKATERFTLEMLDLMHKNYAARGVSL